MMASALVVGEGQVGSPDLWNTRSVPAVFQYCGWFVAAAGCRLRARANNHRGKE